MIRTSLAQAINLEEEYALPENPRAVIRIHSKALLHNYKMFSDYVGEKTKVAATIKANAYGIGAEHVALKLYEAGCQDFFVIHCEEALKVVSCLKNSNIFILNGVYPGTVGNILKHKFIPVIITVDQAKLWLKTAQSLGRKLPAVLHVDTGFARESLSVDELEEIAELPGLFEYMDFKYLMSHLACADEPDHLKNRHQLRLFNDIAKKWPGIHKCFANSYGVALGPEYHFDMVRPGIGLLGYCQAFKPPFTLKTAVSLCAPILKLREIKPGATVGYNALFTADKNITLATLNLGYADGFLRSLTGKGYVEIQGYRSPIMGRISMDYMVVDVSDIPLQLTKPGTWVEIIGKKETIYHLCELAGTCIYEVFARWGDRFERQLWDEAET